MNTFRIPLMLAALAFVSMFTPAVRAGQPVDQATSILIAGLWRIESKQSGLQDRVFNADGTSTLSVSFGTVIKWRIDTFRVTLIYPDHEEELDLPIDPNGTAGKDGKGADISAHMISVIRAQDKVPAPTSSLPGNLPAPAPVPNAANAASTLIAAKWHFAASTGAEDERAFAPNGTLVVQSKSKATKIAGTWAVAGNLLLICLRDHTDVLELPLNPQGTKGQGAHAITFVATQEAVAAPAVAVAPAPVTGAQPAVPAPVVPAVMPSASGIDAQTQNDAAILATGSWTMKGKNWRAVMKFAPDGTGTVESTWNQGSNKSQTGPLKWTINHFNVTVHYSDNEITITLPINTRGLMGKDSNGVDFTALHAD